MTDVLEEVLSLERVYFPLGECLRLSNDSLKQVCKSFPDDSVADKALKQVLLLWLGQEYNVSKFGSPTWRMLVEAVDKKTGGNDHELAKRIAQNHLSGIYIICGVNLIVGSYLIVIA